MHSCEGNQSLKITIHLHQLWSFPNGVPFNDPLFFPPPMQRLRHQETPGQIPAETTAGTLEMTAVPESSLATLHKSVSSP